ncbi:uncharacterized protein LOC124416262 [Diprion similis]|uniref:uncharacterized protein LOC124416262 n=1 Tax=Diprion similis TaxID=362088 RepID=UPI001EF81A30|nr:uncharacterized protein LOC124416262 [Diprion similis]
MVGAIGLVEVLCAVAVILTGVWYYLVANYSFWKERGVPGPEPEIIFGNIKNIALGREFFGLSLKNMCDPFPGAPLVGIYARRQPLLLVRDPDLVKDVMIKDFSNFSDRGIEIHEKFEPFDLNLFNLEPTRWRPLRSKLSPAFTSGKMKHMFTLMTECAEHFEKYVDTLVETGKPIDCREITAKFTTDVIGSCAFGLQMNAIADDDSEFRKMGRKVFQPTLRNRILGTLRIAAPWLFKLLGIPKNSSEITEFFTSSLKQTMDHRMKNNIPRGDLVDILIDIKKNREKSDFELTDALIAAQAFVFFVAGFETSSTTISHALLELAQRHDIQERLRQEIKETLDANNGRITYDSVKEMKYLDMVFQETLRLRPPVTMHLRKAMSDYTFRDTEVTISKGQRVWIPVWDIHQNPEYYPNPEVFDPERFTDEMVKARHPMTYIPFGDGPRNCIGARFGIYQTKLGLVKILLKFKVEVCEETRIPYKPDPKSLLLTPLGGVYLKFSKISHDKIKRVRRNQNHDRRNKIIHQVILSNFESEFKSLRFRTGVRENRKNHSNNTIGIITNPFNHQYESLGTLQKIGRPGQYDLELDERYRTFRSCIVNITMWDVTSKALKMIGAFGFTETLCAVAIVLIGIWYYFVANYNFWKKRGVPGPEPGLIFGNMKDVLFVKNNLGEMLRKICKQFPSAPMIGVYDRRTPVLILRDPELIKDVMIKDFASFSERGLPIHEKVEPLSTHLFNLETTRWRPLRSKLSPVFTSGKMKNMFYLILECAEYFEKYLHNIVEKGEPINCREITAKYTTDVIGSCAFGLQMNALASEDSEFRNMGRKFFALDRKRRILNLIRSSVPWLYELIGMSAMGDDIDKFFLTSVKETIDYRTKNNVRRADIIETLMEIKNHPEKTNFELSDSIIAAQAFVFFIAGFETSSTTISHALMELAQNHDMQDRLRREIVESLKASNGDITYDGVKQLKYLDMVFKETLRLRPPVPLHMRMAVTDYTFRDINVTIPKGQQVWIPIWDIQLNPEYYPKPEVFDPERFTDEMVKARHPMTYTPFGDGPRNCIGARFGTYQTKLGLIKILSNFKVDMCDKTKIPYKSDPKSFLLAPIGGVHLKFSKIK